MRSFAYNEMTGSADAPRNEVITLTEIEILDRYYPHWSGMMLSRHKSPAITEANCLDEFVVVYWAWEVK